MVDSIAAALATGSEPGRPRQTGQVWVLGSAPNVGRAAAEHLRGGAQLDVGLQADHRLVAGEDLVEVDQRVGAHGVGPPWRGAVGGRSADGAPTAGEHAQDDEDGEDGAAGDDPADEPGDDDERGEAPRRP